MKLYLMPKEPTWWIWLATASLLAIGVAGIEAGLYAAIALSVAQCIWIVLKQRAWRPYPVQIRVAFTACLFVYLTPGLKWMFWVPTLGTLALVLFGYCLMARLLSLMPWNRTQPITATLLRRTFLTAPMPGRADHGLPESMSPCEVEACIAQR